MRFFLGIDVGSVTTKAVVIDENNDVVSFSFTKTQGKPIVAVQKVLSELKKVDISGVGTTGSARHLAAAIVGADIVKNEITAHAVAALDEEPKVRTIIEIGGQDSKIIIIKDGIVVDFAMNTVCAAGTGSFLDQQASRLGIPIEEFGALALESDTDVSIAGRCTVFAESDMIHKQQMGYETKDIINGLSKALVRNYLNNIGKGKDIEEPILFQGGVASNIGIRKAFGQALDKNIIVPSHNILMGAIGSAILAKKTSKTKFKGFDVKDLEFEVKSIRCRACANECEIMSIEKQGKVIARLGGHLKSKGPPGWKTLMKGMDRFLGIAEGYALASAKM